mmetsp:Transcript_667/g.1900  ORF Transcript_667/g.1900 Transcript_667/m.1900 type:complete len:134 (+) Transcript_667:1827-2228(+)
MSSSGDAIVAPDCESRWASRDDALVRGRAGAPRLGPARAARSSRELFRFSLCWILALLAASRRLAPIASIESVFLMTQASARVAGYPLEGREIICVFAGFFASRARAAGGAEQYQRRRLAVHGLCFFAETNAG